MKYGKSIKIFNPEKLNRHNIDKQSMELISRGSRILEIGCATGFMGEYLIKKKKCSVYGVELGKDEAKEANNKLTKVIVGDIEDKKTIDKVRNLGKFDVVLASALIEHLKDPWNALSFWKKLLNKDGYLIISTSNIVYWSTRLNIFLGRFEYQNYGIMDNAHLRFFTPKTFKKLVEDCGYKIEYFGIDAEGGGYPKLSIFLSRFFPNLFAYQMVIKARLWKK